MRPPPLLLREREISFHSNVFEFYVVFETGLTLKLEDLKLDILKIEGARYETILVADANANLL